MNFKTLEGQLRIAAIIEGITFLLFAITMPLKYVLGIKGPNYIVGMIHGLVFIDYIVLVIWVAIRHKLPLLTTFLCLLASLLPTATFFAEKKVFSKL